jgi:hypothetical protein
MHAHLTLLAGIVIISKATIEYQTILLELVISYRQCCKTDTIEIRTVCA